MKRFLLTYILASAFLTFYALPPDTIPFNNFKGFYINMYYGIPKHYDLNYSDNKFSNPDAFPYTFEQQDFKTKTPNIGIGYILKKNILFMRADISYSYRVKKIDYQNEFVTTDLNGTSSGVLDAYPNLYTFPVVGQKYFEVNETMQGNLFMHYLEINAAVGANFNSNCRIYAGCNYSALLNYNYSATLNRQGLLYNVIAYNPSIGTYTAVLIQTENSTYQNKEIKSHIGQNFSGTLYASVGANISFKCFERIAFVEMQYDFCMPPTSGNYRRKDYLSLKLGYCFRYSEDFGQEKKRR